MYNETCLKCIYQLKQTITSREKMLQLISTRWKVGLKFQNPKFNILMQNSFYLLLQKSNPLELRGPWGNSGTGKSDWIRLWLCTSIS